MTSKQGDWVKRRQRPHPTPEGRVAVREQHAKIAEAGKLIKEKCTGKTGDAFKKCKSDVLRDFFGEKKKQA